MQASDSNQSLEKLKTTEESETRTLEEIVGSEDTVTATNKYGLTPSQIKIILTLKVFYLRYSYKY